MAKKKFNLKFSFDAPVTLSFVIISVILFILNNYVIKSGALGNILSSPTTQSGVLPFIVKQPVSYLRLFLYIFGSGEVSSYMTDILIILMLAPAMEERYGSVIIGIMIFVSALFSGVLNACFCTECLTGAVPVICMMIFLTAFMSFSNKTVPITFIATIIAFGYLAITSGLGAIRLIICVAGGLCGSLFAFLTSPKVKAAKKNSSGSASTSTTPKRKGGLLNRAEKAALAEEIDSQSPRNKKPHDSLDDDDETTVVGTLKF